MDQTDDTTKQPKVQLDKAYEDPHFHDDDLEPPEERDHKGPHAPAWRKPARRIPPPPRRRSIDD
jgi:hypothetical protein